MSGLLIVDRGIARLQCFDPSRWLQLYGEGKAVAGPVNNVVKFIRLGCVQIIQRDIDHRDHGDEWFTVGLELSDNPIVVRSRNAAESKELEEALLEALKEHINAKD